MYRDADMLLYIDSVIVTLILSRDLVKTDPPGRSHVGIQVVRAQLISSDSTTRSFCVSEQKGVSFTRAERALLHVWGTKLLAWFQSDQTSMEGRYLHYPRDSSDLVFFERQSESTRRFAFAGLHIGYCICRPGTNMNQDLSTTRLQPRHCTQRE